MEGEMKNKSIRTVILIITCAILLLGVYGCASNTPESSPSPTALSQSTTPLSSSPTVSSTYAKEIVVFAAAGTKPAIDEVAKLFEQKYGTKVSINYGGGGEVLSNMVIAKRGDIYIAPEQRFMNSAKKQGAVDNNTTATSLAYMIPVIGVKKGNPQSILSLADLAKPGIKVVMGNPETTALGEIVPQMLQKAGVYDAVKLNIVTNAPQVTAIITMLKMNQVDAGVIWHYFGATSANDVDIIWIPKEYVTGIGEIQAAVSTYTQEAITAQKFVELLVSSEGKDIFNKNGYIVDRDEAGKYWMANK
jgi:molybdate transport system substrate-binding protein